MQWQFECSTGRLDRVRNDDVRAMFGVAAIMTKMRNTRLRWYGHVLRSDDSSAVESAMNIIIDERKTENLMAG
ncbi:hypothetical protein Y032_0659g1259 [Ancylostoma ceylanicum]|uniref:Uncharacterized protein n=1 Tax=Ancylostoma ceylanicum TaxID=53326 RepID=A0A016WK12_9BILA|nr:hypothetical protein Y032_0659g1259 [Ancylostoma ceylanicum]